MGVVGAAIKGFGKALAKGKKAKLVTVGKLREGVDIKQFKKSKKHGLREKFGVWSNREAGKTLTEMGSGVSVKFKKSGMPYVPKGTKPSILTKAKGLTKLVSPIAAGLTGGAIHGKIKGKKKIGGHYGKKRTFLQRSELQTVRQ